MFFELQQRQPAIERRIVVTEIDPKGIEVGFALPYVNGHIDVAVIFVTEESGPPKARMPPEELGPRPSRSVGVFKRTGLGRMDTIAIKNFNHGA